MSVEDEKSEDVSAANGGFTTCSLEQVQWVRTQTDSNNTSNDCTCISTIIIQVATELEGKHLDGKSFSSMYIVPPGAELAFPQSVYEIMNLFCQSIHRY